MNTNALSDALVSAMDEEERKRMERARIMMADLSRLRQEELPLSNREKRAPSYAPTRKNGTDHIPHEEKEKLKTQWNVEFDDEEARQCEGLAIEDARPYAKAHPAAPIGVHPYHVANPRRAPISFQLPDSTVRSKKKKTKNVLSVPPSVASETGSIAASKPSWAARRAYAMTLQPQNTGQLPKASSIKSRSVIASANDFLKSTGTPASRDVPKLQENRPIHNAAHGTMCELPKNVATTNSEVVPSIRKPQLAKAVSETAAPAVQLPGTTLIDLEVEAERPSEADDQEMALLGLLEAKSLLDIARSLIPALIEGKLDERTCRPTVQVALRTILGGLVLLKKSEQRKQSVSSSLPQQSPEASTTTMAELMELVESINPPRYRYSPSELLQLRKIGNLQPKDKTKVEGIKMENVAFTATRKSRAQKTLPESPDKKIQGLAPIAGVARVADKSLDEEQKGQREITRPYERVTRSASEAEDSVDVLARKTAYWTLDDMPAVRSLPKTHRSSNGSQTDRPHSVQPSEESSAAGIEANSSGRDQERISEAKAPEEFVERVIRALALLDAEDAKAELQMSQTGLAEKPKKHVRQQTTRASQQREMATSGVGSKKPATLQKGLASSMWA